MAAVTLARQQFGNSIAIDIGKLERVDLGVGFVDHMLQPPPVCAIAPLFQPIKAVVVSLAINNVHLAIVIHVVAEDGKAGVA